VKRKAGQAGEGTLVFPHPVTLDQLIQATHRTHKMGTPGKKTMDSEAARIREALDKGKNPLSEEEIHFIRTCCQIMKISEKEKIESIGETATWEGNRENSHHLEAARGARK
jgi:hypothetical protein